MNNKASKFHSRQDIGTYYDEKMTWYSGLNLPLNEQIDRYISAKNTKKPLTILDVGCGPGTLGAHYKKLGHKVIGVDIAPNAIRKAKKQLDDAIVADVEKEIPAELRAVKFDLIVFADILEHTFSPTTILLNLKRCLKPDGAIAISLPNIANYTVRLNLLRGRFDYRSSGIMDDTHVRFFTEKTFRKMLREAGFEVIQFSASANNRFERIPILHILEKKLSQQFRNFLGYQLIVVAKKL